MIKGLGSTFVRHVLFILALAVIVVLPICFFGMTSGNDMVQHFQFAETAHNAVSSGEFYPGFSSATNFGLGDVGLRFYPPLTYYLMSLFRAVSGDWYWSGVLTIWLIFFSGGVGIYLWVREIMPEVNALAAAAIFMLSPYHLNLIYNNFLLAEFAATAIFPFCFFFLLLSRLLS